MIPLRNPSPFATRLAMAERRHLPGAVLELASCRAGHLVALLRTSLLQRLAFKCGTAVRRCGIGGYRFSEGLSSLLAAESPFHEIRRSLDPLFAETRGTTGEVLRLARKRHRTGENSHTFCLGNEGCLWH